jgi:hypothetical protein
LESNFNKCSFEEKRASWRSSVSVVGSSAEIELLHWEAVEEPDELVPLQEEPDKQSPVEPPHLPQELPA